MKENTISVIVPVYNVEMYLEECLMSLVKQTREAEEIILINDGSTDNSLSICEKYAKNFKNIHVFSQNNQGLGATRNRAIELAKSEYLVFVDSDDFVKKDMIEKLKKKLERNKLDVLYYDATIISNNDIKISSKDFYNRSKVLSERCVMNGLQVFMLSYPHNYLVSSCLGVYRKTFLLQNNIKFPEKILHEDELFSFLVINSAEKVMYLHEDFYIRRYRDNSIMTSGWSYLRWYGMTQNYILIWNEIYKKKERYIDDIRIIDYILAFMQNKLWNIQSLKCKNNNNELMIEDKVIAKEFWRTWNVLCEHLLEDSFIKVKGTLLFIKYIEINKVINESREYEQLIKNKKDLIDQYNGFLKNKFKSLPFENANKKVGIYGIGKHTKNLIEKYEELIGKIKCKYFFIESNVEKNNIEYNNIPVKSIIEADKDMDNLVVSSFKFQDSINEMIDSVLGNNYKRINIYAKEDLVDLFID